MNNEKLYDALQTIKECCTENKDCFRCPLSILEKDGQLKCKVGDNEHCDIPKYWKLVKPQYKAFEIKENNPTNGLT